MFKNSCSHYDKENVLKYWTLGKELKKFSKVLKSIFLKFDTNQLFPPKFWNAFRCRKKQKQKQNSKQKQKKFCRQIAAATKCAFK